MYLILLTLILILFTIPYYCVDEERRKPLFLNIPSKVVCDQPTRTFKNSAQSKIEKITIKDLKEIFNIPYIDFGGKI